MSETLVVPDSIEPIVGYKWLTIASDGHLYSGHFGSHHWPPLEALRAHCALDWGYGYQPRPWWEKQPGPSKKDWKAQQEMISSTATVTPLPRQKKPKLKLPYPLAWSWEPNQPDHDAPGEGCSCGIYVMNKEKDCQGYRGYYNAVLVEVALWGKVVVASDGARGELAYPRRILRRTEKTDPEHVKKAHALYRLAEPGPAKPKPEPAPTPKADETQKKKRLW